MKSRIALAGLLALAGGCTPYRAAYSASHAHVAVLATVAPSASPWCDYDFVEPTLGVTSRSCAELLDLVRGLSEGPELERLRQAADDFEAVNRKPMVLPMTERLALGHRYQAGDSWLPTKHASCTHRFSRVGFSGDGQVALVAVVTRTNSTPECGLWELAKRGETWIQLTGWGCCRVLAVNDR